jgi:hypothetical protein
MNFLKKGPEIKFSGLRIPDALRDLYRDLDDRHLVPVVALLLIAIVAVPLLLSGSNESEATPDATPIAAAPPASAIEVSKATPRLRPYQHRLGHLTATNPFGPPPGESSTAAEGGGEASGSGAEEFSAPEESAPASIEPETGGSELAPETESSGGGHESNLPASPVAGNVTYFSYAIDVRVVPVSVEGKKTDAKPTVRKSLPPLVMLPSRDTPALTYVATSKDHTKAVMVVSSDVTALFGDSKCVVGSEDCQLLALEEGAPETVVYGPTERTYRIELRKIELVTTDSLNVNPLGEPEKGKTKGSGEGSSRALGRLVPAVG